MPLSRNRDISSSGVGGGGGIDGLWHSGSWLFFIKSTHMVRTFQLEW